MNCIRRSSFTRSFLIPFALTIWLSACHTWVEVEPPQRALQEQADRPPGERETLRLLMGEYANLYEGKLYRLTEDSLGLVKGNEHTTLPIREVTQVEVRRADHLATAGVVVGTLALAFGIAMIVAFHSVDLGSS